MKLELTVCREQFQNILIIYWVFKLIWNWFFYHCVTAVKNTWKNPWVKPFMENVKKMTITSCENLAYFTHLKWVNEFQTTKKLDLKSYILNMPVVVASFKNTQTGVQLRWHLSTTRNLCKAGEIHFNFYLFQILLCNRILNQSVTTFNIVYKCNSNNEILTS